MLARTGSPVASRLALAVHCACRRLSSLTHIDSRGEASMVDVSHKADTARTAVAAASVYLGPSAFTALAAGSNAKGNVLVTARLAGIMAAKRTSELIPLCHPIGLSHVGVEFNERPEAYALVRAFTALATPRTIVLLIERGPPLCMRSDGERRPCSRWRNRVHRTSRRVQHALQRRESRWRP
jgi:molybdenum cofactor biosynthesis protein MoaC